MNAYTLPWREMWDSGFIASSLVLIVTVICAIMKFRKWDHMPELRARRSERNEET